MSGAALFASSSLRSGVSFRRCSARVALACKSEDCQQHVQ
jgi:hypothetical protein